jgi:hypothetical protein
LAGTAESVAELSDLEYLTLDRRDCLPGQDQLLAGQPGTTKERDGAASGTVRWRARHDLPADRGECYREPS